MPATARMLPDIRAGQKPTDNRLRKATGHHEDIRRDCCRSGAQHPATARATTLDHLTAAASGHSGAETVVPFALDYAGLKCSFHEFKDLLIAVDIAVNDGADDASQWRPVPEPVVQGGALYASPSHRSTPGFIRRSGRRIGLAITTRCLNEKIVVVALVGRSGSCG